MLANLRIENFAIIEDIDISLNKGMNVLVGETGAGKSIIIDALNLLTGKRSSFDKVRNEEKKAIIEGTFIFDTDFINNHESLKEYIDENNTLIITRSLLASKSSIVRINGETSSLQVLSSLMKDIIDIHSQGDNNILFDESNHIFLVDNFEKEPSYLNLLNQYRKSYAKIIEKKNEISNFISATDLSQKDYLKYQIDEIEKYNLQPNEIEDLNEELLSLNSFSSLSDAFNEFKTFYYGNDSLSVMSYLSNLESKINGLKDGLLKEEANAAYESLNDFEEKLDGIFTAYSKLNFSLERIEEINARLFDLSTLKHKFGRTTNQILDVYSEYKTKLLALDSYDDKLKELNDELVSFINQTKELAIKISSMRRKAAERLENAVNSELSDLGILQGGFKVNIASCDENKNGCDKVRFEIALNKGMKFVPLKEAASGGENSRLMLALKTVFNSLDPYDTIVFDEIDTGISGPIATMVSKKIKKISKKSMVIVISHLPQVVANGDNHYLVYKSVEDNVTKSHIKEIDEGQVIKEVGKMLSGDKLSSTALEAAKEMINEVKNSK